MFYREKSNTIKLIINSFANGDVGYIKQFVSKYGEEIFEYTPKMKNGNYNRLAFYMIKNGHFDAFKLYLKSSKPIHLSNSELWLIAKHNSSKKRFKPWMDNYLKNPEIQEFIKFESIHPLFLRGVIASYDPDLIDQFLELYPNTYDTIVNSINHTNRGTQLKRHLKLSNLL